MLVPGQPVCTLRYARFTKRFELKSDRWSRVTEGISSTLKALLSSSALPVSLLPVTLSHAQTMRTYSNPALCYSAVNLSNGNLSVGIWNSSNPPATNSPLNKFLQCAGLPTNMSLSSQDHVQNLRGILEAALDVYSFMRSTFDQNPIMEMLAAISANPDSYVFHNVDLVKIWFQVKLKPLLSTVSRQFLSCLSTRNFTCQTYQTVVQELNSHFPTMDPFRQKWIYLSFMYPFLAGNNSAGCVSQGDTSEDWLTKNFGAFSVVAKFKDFITLNAVFNGLEVLHHLTQEQKAELLLNPGASLDNSSLIVIFQNLFLGNQFPNGSIALNNTTTPAPMTTLGPPRTQQNPFEQAFKTFQRFFKPLGSFVKEIVSLTQGNLTNMKSTTFAQGIMNWSLAELAGQFGKNVTEASKSLSGQTAWLDSLNATDVTAWFQHVVAPVLRRFLPANQTEIPQHLTAVFYHLFSLNNSTAPQVSAPPDVCTITLKNPPDAVCSAISTVEHLTQVFSCISHTNLSLTEGNMMVLLTELSQVLNSLIQQYSSLNFSSAGSQLADIFGQLHAETFTEENLQDVSFVSLWFQIKLKPLLPSISNDFLSCLSTKNFTCETFQALVRGLSDNISPMDKTRQQSVYTHFIRPFLSRRNAPDRGCASNTNGSMDWLVKNFGTFSAFAPLQDFYDVYANFSALDSLEVLTPKQTAELIVRPQNGPAQKRIIVDAVFDYVLESPRGRHLEEILNSLVKLSTEVNASIAFNTHNHFQKLNQALPSVPSDTESVIWRSLNDLMLTAPVGESLVTLVARTPSQLFHIYSSTELQLHLNTGDFARMLCNFSVKQYACASLTQITAENLASLLGCKLTSHNVTTSKETWKLLFTKVAGVLDSAIAIFSNMSLNISSPVMSDILQVIGDIRMSTFNGGQFVAANFTNYWLHGNLRPFLSSASGEFLNCLSSDNLTCEIYQNVLKEFSSQFFKMDPMRKILVYKYFIFPFLSKNTTDPACISNTNGSADWLLKNFGPFSVVAPLPDLLTLNKHFSPMNTLPLLSVSQLAEVAYTPGQLNNPKDVNNLMSYVSNAELEPFFNIFSSVIKGHENEIPLSVRSAMLQQVFHRVNLSNPSVSDAQVLSWLQQRLKPLLINMSVDNVTSYFDTVRNRSCQTIQQAVELLYSIQSTLPEVTQREIYNNIVISMKEPSPLRCYQNNSFYSFLESTFLGFQFPNISTVLSLMPDSRKSLLINSMSLSDLARLLHQPNFVDNSTDLCTIFNYYHNTSVFVEKANVSDGLKQQILPCVWPLALSSENKPDVDAWFKRLGRYLPFLNKDLISSSEMLNTSCLAFQKFVSALGNGYNYSRTNFNKKDVYATIKNYLSTGAKPKCYNATNPDLNSTAWFAEYIGMFITFTTLDDLNSFGSTELQVFATNLANIQLFNNTGFPQNISSFYTELIYQQDPNFNPLLLPLEFRCNAPGSSYTQLNNAEAITVLTNLSQTCSEIDPQIATALAGDLTVSTAAITALGQESSGLTTEQILKAPPSVIVSSLPILSTVNNWNQGQMIAIIQVLTSAGVKINNSAQLLELGTLVEGVPSAVFTNTDPAQLLQLSRNAAFIANLMNAPPIVQYTFINQILSISSTPQSLLVNVPDAMANKIPRSLLTAFPSDASVIQRINMKNWTQDQAVLFFDTVSNAVSDPNTISANVLQGFTCSRVQSFSNNKVLNIIKACQSRGQKKVSLSETQLTCMYNYVQDGNATAFTQYPSDILLYYNYQLVRANCSSYFVQLGTANFDVISDSLAYIKETLLQNAKTCLGISGTKINSTNLKILGNMVCTLNGSYIVSSDPLILEQLKNCNGFTSEQATAIETLLLTGNTTYGSPSTWNVETLNKLGILPLYLTSNFWSHFKTLDKTTFLRSFVKSLREKNTSKAKLSQLFSASNQISRAKRATGCTTGNITAVTISDEAFPFGYDATQFNACLTADVANTNLAALAQKVVNSDFLTIILNKLNQALPSGFLDVVVQQLGPISQVASLADISKWNITKVDTLASLMSSSDGTWTPDQSNFIITKYLSTQGNALGTAELDSVGGPNLCSLNTTVLRTINSSSLRYANVLDLSNCSTENKKVLFNIVYGTFINQTNSSLTSYQLLQPYIGGAPLKYIQLLSTLNISMDVPTLASLDPNVTMALTVTNVKGLLGKNLPQLKTYENVTLIKNWISSQYKSALTDLGLNFTWGKADVTTAAPASQNSTVASVKNATATTATTKSGAEQTNTLANHILPFVFLVLTTVALHGTAVI
ncbi:mesothelin isoform X1 [Arapaima gigas]